MSDIKSRLKLAYDNVEFFASKTWMYESHSFQRANQELFARECKIQDALVEEHNRPRTVQDSIPQSRLAQYSDYEYNESRELCYASNASDILFYYPCTFKRNSLIEPWMLPEIEQVFIWLTYSCEFNLLDPIGIEELDHLDDQDKVKSGKSPSTCSLGDLHELRPIFYQTLERAPGKKRYTDAPAMTKEDLLQFGPELLKVDTFEDMILRMKIKSEKVQHIWDEKDTHCQTPEYKPNVTEKKFDLFKSTLSNFFVFDNTKNIKNMQCIPIPIISTEPWLLTEQPERANDFGHIQQLAESFKALQTWIETSTKKKQTTLDKQVPNAKAKSKQEHIKSDPAPTRRLYSAVLQGLSTKTSDTNSPTVSSPPTEMSFCPKVDKSPETTLNLAAEAFSYPPPPQPPQQWIADAWGTSSESGPRNQPDNLPSTSHERKTDLSAIKTSSTSSGSRSSGSELYFGSLNQPQPPMYYNNGYPSGSSVNSSSYNSYASNSYRNKCGSTYPGVNSNYVQNSYPFNYGNSLNVLNNPPATTSQYKPSAVRNPTPPPAQASRGNYFSRQTPPLWFIHHRTTMYSFPQPFFLIPPNAAIVAPTPSRPPQVWNRPAPEAGCSTYPAKQAYGNNRPFHEVEGFSSQLSPFAFEFQNVSNLPSLQANASATDFLRLRDYNNVDEMSSMASSKASSLEYAGYSRAKFLRTTASCPSLKKSSKSEDNDDAKCSAFSNEDLPFTAVEDLEKQALEQYQGSNENFYQELERQAAEQYEENSENWMSPPSNVIIFGGLQRVAFVAGRCFFLLVAIYIDIFACCLLLLS